MDTGADEVARDRVARPVHAEHDPAARDRDADSDTDRDGPTRDPHTLAIALHYDRQGAPTVVAKGRGELARRIVEVARENNVPVEEDEALALALSNVELGDEIPPELYRAVAEVLVFILKVSRRLS